MNNQCVVAVFDKTSHAQSAIESLYESSFKKEQLSIVKQYFDRDSDIGRKLNLEDDSLHDAAIAATLGGIVGLVTDAAVAAVVGISVIVFAGPIVVATGVVVGGFLGALAGSGVHSSQIKYYESLVKDDKLLLIVDGEPDELSMAHSILLQTSATEVNSHATTGGDDPVCDN